MLGGCLCLSGWTLRMRDTVFLREYGEESRELRRMQ